MSGRDGKSAQNKPMMSKKKCENVFQGAGSDKFVGLDFALFVVRG